MIKVHIRRSVTDDQHDDLLALISQLRAAIAGHPGYLSSETLLRVDPPGEILVVSKWQSLFYWQQWYGSQERTQIQDRIDDLLASPTAYEVYEYA